jgi:hypothetical protein
MEIPVLNQYIFEKCNHAVLISGSARSGTTILGKIISSFKHVEYSFEPPLFFSLFALIQSIDENSWKLLYETYLYEEFLMNAIAGRGLNCNLSDDSSVFHVKPEAEIQKRLSGSLSKTESEHLSKVSRIAYKIPDVVPFIPQLKKYYPETEVIIMKRTAPESIHSILAKGWFSDQALKNGSMSWPNRIVGEFCVPFWVDPKDDRMWCELNEINRTAYYYIRVNKPIEDIPGCLTIRYRDLVEKPKPTAEMIAEKLNVTFGERTEEILNTVKYRTNKTNPGMMKELNSEFRKQVEYYSSLS